MPDKYDSIIIGAGVNGLTLANYLMKAGQKVLLIERRYEVGGNMITEDFGGARYDLHSSYMLLAPNEIPPYEHLELKERGCSFVEPRSQASIYVRGRRMLTVYRDAKVSAKSISKISHRDAEKFEKMSSEIRSFRGEVVVPWFFNAPKGSIEAIQPKFVHDSNQSPIEYLNEEIGFESEELKTLLLFLGCMWGIDPRKQGVIAIFLFLLDGMLSASIVRGGASFLPSSLYKPLIAGGSDIIEGKEVTRILFEGGRVRGVELADRTRIESEAVVSTLDVKTTFEKLFRENALPRNLLSRVQNWSWDPWSLFQAHWTLTTRPNFKEVSLDEESDEPLLHVVGYDSTDELLNHLDKVSNGEANIAAGCVSFPSILDPARAPSGLTIAKFTSLAPFKLSSGKWDEIKEGLAEECLSLWSSLATNVTNDSIISKYAYPPTYIEMKLPNCVQGSLNSGAQLPEQIGVLRPSIDCSSYRTPIRGLYICGASVHPGGLALLAGGYNAASVICDDYGLKKWWRPRN